jgi:hypothetical protein
MEVHMGLEVSPQEIEDAKKISLANFVFPIVAEVRRTINQCRINPFLLTPLEALHGDTFSYSDWGANPVELLEKARVEFKLPRGDLIAVRDELWIALQGEPAHKIEKFKESDDGNFAWETLETFQIISLSMHRRLGHLDRQKSGVSPAVAAAELDTLRFSESSFNEEPFNRLNYVIHLEDASEWQRTTTIRHRILKIMSDHAVTWPELSPKVG